MHVWLLTGLSVKFDVRIFLCITPPPDSFVHQPPETSVTSESVFGRVFLIEMLLFFKFSSVE